MKRLLTVACALAAIASATPAPASQSGSTTQACSVAYRGHPRVHFKACAVDIVLSQGIWDLLVKTPDGRRFVIEVNMRVYPPPNPAVIDGKPAKLMDGGCVENGRVSICGVMF